MLVQNSVYRNTYLTDGINKDFYFSFPILEASQVLVQTSLLTDTNTVTTVDPGQYTVIGVGQTTGGHISFTTAPPTGSRLALTLNIPITQVYQYAELDSFPAKSHEDALAKLTLICQQLKEQLERAFRLPATSSKTPQEVLEDVYSTLEDVYSARDRAEIAAANTLKWLNEVGTEVATNSFITAANTTTARTLADRFADTVNVKDFGAVGDGTAHTVQEWIDAGKYASLAEIQDVCPDVKSLDDYIDFAATSAAMAYIKQQGGGVIEFPATGSEYVLNQLLFGSNAQDITLLGVGARMHIVGGQIQATRAKRVNILGFEHIRFTREGNGISFADPQECVVDVRKLSGATGFQTIFYTPDRGASGVCYGNVISVGYIDGAGIARGGIGMESAENSYMRATVTGIYGDLGYAVNFKNACKNCHADVIGYNNHYSFVLSDNGPSVLAAGCKNVTANVVSRGSLIGVSVNKASGCHVTLQADMGGLAGSLPLLIAGYNGPNSFDVRAFNCDPDGHVFTSRSDFQNININTFDNSSNKIGLFEAGTDRNRVFVGMISGITGNGPDITQRFDNHTSNLTNEVYHLRDLPNVELGDTRGKVVIPVPGQSRATAWVSADVDGTLVLRTGNASALTLSPSVHSAFFPNTDNVVSFGRSRNRFTQFYAGAGTINTSDEREKTDWREQSIAEKAAAIEIKAAIKAYKFTGRIRTHFGVGAQTVGSILHNHGLNPDDYAFWCYDTWNEQPEIKDADGNVVQEYRPAGSRYGIRYDELCMFILAAI